MQGRSEQRAIVQDLTDRLSDLRPRLVDRIASPREGYRALHLVVRQHGVPVEIQVRTLLQHRWAEMYEKLGDVAGRGIRYGEGVDPTIDSRMLRFQARLLVRSSWSLAESLNIAERMSDVGQDAPPAGSGRGTPIP